MSRITIDQVAPKYRTVNIGTRNPLVYICRECEYKIPDGTIRHAVGFGEVLGDVVMVIACPKCGTRFWHHVRYEEYKMFLQHLELSVPQPPAAEEEER